MHTFADTVKQDTPRLVIMFQCQDGQERFQWGMVGKIPLLSLIGCIARVQGDLVFRAAQECPQPALVIAWDEDKHGFSWYVHPDVPIDSMIGMLETIKAALIGTNAARQAASQQMILGPDGQPMRG